MVGQWPLKPLIGVRIPVPEQNFSQKTSLILVKFSGVFCWRKTGFELFNILCLILVKINKIF